MDSEFQYNPMKRLCKTCRICWAIGHKHCPSLQTRWTGFSIDSPLHRLKSNPVQGNGEIGPSLPFLGHSQFQFPAIKAIWSTCTSRATGNIFSSFYLLLSITFFFKRTPHSFPILQWLLMLTAALRRCHWEAFAWAQGPCRSWASEEGGPGLVPALRNAGQPRGQRSPGHGSITEQHSQHGLAKVFSLFWNCFTGLMREQDSAAGSRGVFF